MALVVLVVWVALGVLVSLVFGLLVRGLPGPGSMDLDELGVTGLARTAGEEGVPERSERVGDVVPVEGVAPVAGDGLDRGVGFSA